MRRVQNTWIANVAIRGIPAAATAAFMFLNTAGQFNAVIGVLVLVMGLMSMIQVRRNWYLLIVYACVWYSNYSICVANYISPVTSMFTTLREDPVAVVGLNLIASFAILMLLIIPPEVKKPEKPQSLLKQNQDNPIIVLGLAVLLAVIFVVGFTRPSVEGERGSPSAIYEYSVILIILGFYFSGKRRLFQLLYVGIAAAFALQNFMYGGRITGVQVVLCVVLCFYVDRLTFRLAIPAAVAFFVAMVAVGAYRAHLSGVDAADVLDVVGQSLERTKLTMDTAYSANYCSLTFLQFMKDTTLFQRLYYFGCWVLSMFLGGGVANSNLASLTAQAGYVHFGGGILPYFAYFYLGIPGVLLLAGYLGWLLRKAARTTVESSGLARCMTVYLVSTVFRWYLYSPSELFRGVMLMCVFYGLCFLFHRESGRS